MKKLITLLVCSAFITTQAQVIYTETFEGGAPTFTLNTADAGSNTSAYNNFVINNSYAGGTYTEPCYGVSAPVASTTAQPSGIVGYPNSKYLHVVCNTAASAGITNANFLSSDGGIFGCVNDEAVFAKMTNDISTVGMSGVTFSYYYMCAGAATSYGQTYYSTNAGASWNLLQTNIYGISSWTQSTVTNAVFDNQATLRFGFRFVNNFTFSTVSDPPLCVDDVSIYVPASASITTGVINPTAICAGANINVPYTITGTFTPGNIFSAQLSDQFGSFASPITIGTLVSTSAGTISATIPGGTAPGSGYLIRVISSTPAVTGSSSATLTVSAAPTAGADNGGPFCTRDNIDLSATGGVSYSWAGPNSFGSISQNPIIPNALLVHAGTYTVTVTNASGCTATATTTVVVNSSPTAVAGNTGPYCVGDAAQLSASGGSGYEWSGPSSYTNFTQNPTINNVQLTNSGNYTVIVTSAQGCKDTTETFMLVQNCGSGIEDEFIQQVSVYPNPAADVFTVSINENMVQNTKIEIMNLVGEMVYTMMATQPKTTISSDALSLKSGIYLVKISYASQQKVVRLIVR